MESLNVLLIAVVGCVMFCFVVGLAKNCILLWEWLMLKKKRYTETNHHNVATRHALSVHHNVCASFVHTQKYGSARELVKYFMEMQSGDQTMHRIFSQMPETWDSTSLAQLAQTPPQPTIFRLSQWNLSNHTAGGWKDSWVATFFYLNCLCKV